MNVLHNAFELRDKGCSVVPLDYKQKRPPKDFALAEYFDRKPSHEEIRAWFGEEVRNLGLVTGTISDLAFVDCDTRDDAVWWHKQHPTPCMNKTSRGVQFGYQLDGEEIKNRVGLFDRKIDVRGEHGLVVAPPSIHPTGAQYTWVEPWHLKDVPTIQKTWLPEEQEVPKFQPVQAVTPIMERMRRYGEQIHAVSGQNGHGNTFRYACKLAESGMTEGEVLQVLSEWNETNAEPPWSVAELKHKVEDAFRVTLQKMNHQLAMTDGCRSGSCDTGGRMQD